MPTAPEPMPQVAQQVASALVKISLKNEGAARLSLPLLYPGGSMVGVELSRLRDGFLVSDAGGARREAGLLGGERTFAQIAREIADRFGVRFDRNMFFDLDVPENALVVAVVAVANAAKVAVESTALHLASVQHSDYRAHLLERLDKVYGPTAVSRNRRVRGSSSEVWEFDAVIKTGSQLTLFELVVPYANAVNSAVTKFLDIRDLGRSAPNRIAVLTDIDRTPHLAVLARTARYIPFQASDEEYRKAA